MRSLVEARLRARRNLRENLHAKIGTLAVDRWQITVDGNTSKGQID
ncbi:MAG: hypothetical protein Rhims3KO_05270 [Hyphomicrobiales bacterium]